MKNRLIIILVFVLPLLLYGILLQINPQKAQDIFMSYEAMAQKTQTAKIIKFSVPLCMDCQKLDNKLNKIMPKYSKSVTLQRVDASENSIEIDKLIKQYNVTTAPTTVFINSKGKMVKKIEGDIPQIELERQIRAIL